MVRAAFMAHPTRPLEGSNVERSAAAHRAGCEATLVERARDRKARAPAPAPAPAARGADGRYDGVRYTDDGVQIPVGNGGIAATHSWTQTLYETTVTIDVPAATKAKDVACKISARGLTLDIAGGAVSLAGNWYDVIDAGASCWTLDRPGRDRACLVLTLEKTQETWWRSVFKDAPKADQIDAQKVDSTKRMDEYDEKTQAGIRKCMFDQRQRRRGLPTSEESQVDSILESAKNPPNSPFRTDGPPPTCTRRRRHALNPVFVIFLRGPMQSRLIQRHCIRTKRRLVVPRGPAAAHRKSDSGAGPTPGGPSREQVK